MRFHRRVALLMGGLTLAGAVVAGWWLARPAGPGPEPRPPDWAAGFERVRPGMSLAEVEALMGGPPGNYGRGLEQGMSLEGVLVPPGTVERAWADDGARYEVYFDPAGRVVVTHRRKVYRQTGGPAR